ncbi:hypothetical protein J4N46_00310 [Capnocytophaga sp. Marseille-Q4570]|uniref:Uncharacterized protein n=1 Tax=Capnocytophaga bilenii TaxID=2819369 RepID=A0ABS3PUI1_9FLAO|nr:hypothetical protein [Capnocytophaga bilenii]MBO1882912.1 hypothetical protein [Capnocytophaga bilenii]
MKLYILCFFIFFTATTLAQIKRITILKDEGLNYQEKRMVTGIGWDADDFKPDPKYPKLFGYKIGNTNISAAHAAVWGDILGLDLGTLSGDIRRNQRYKNGRDIRPLGPYGQETQRHAKLLLMKKEAELAKKHIDSIYSRSMADLAHYTYRTAKADPMYLLYYKRMLTPLANFPDNPQSYQDWGFKNPKAFANAKATGQIKSLEKKLYTIKTIYEKALKLDMPRGKRFLMYHKAMIGWKEFLTMLEICDKSNNILIEGNRKRQEAQRALDGLNKHYDDVQIMQEILREYKNKYGL